MLMILHINTRTTHSSTINYISLTAAPPHSYIIIEQTDPPRVEGPLSLTPGPTYYRMQQQLFIYNTGSFNSYSSCCSIETLWPAYCMMTCGDVEC